MILFEESDLVFEFGSHWQVFQFDKHHDYQNMKDVLEQTKGIDFLGIYDNRELYLIEVKNFRGYRIENRDRLLRGELAIEVAQKVRDSLACIIGAYHTSTLTEHWEPYLSFLCDRHGSIKIALWLEEDLPPPHPRLRQKAKASVETKVFKQKLTWLTRRVLVCGGSKEGLLDVRVSNLPRH